MINFWHSLNNREKVFVATGIAITVIFLIYIVIFKPLSDSRNASELALQEEKARFERIVALAAQAENSTSSTTSTSNSMTPIREAATITSRATGVAISRIQPGPNNTVSFWVDNGGVRDIFNWLIQLNDQYGKNVQKVSLQKNVGEDTIRGQFEFQENRQ